MALEIERKFLIKLTDEIISHAVRTLEIEQTYLKRSDPDVQRRIRRITEGNKQLCYYTEKKFVTDITREECERIINPAEYNRLLTERLPDCEPIIKTRRIIEWKNQCFEMDSYPFSAELATIELELSDEKQPIELPPFADVIKEVTGDPTYSNASLAARKNFPDIIA